MGRHLVLIARDEGGKVKRAFHFMKPESLVHIGVSVINLRTREEWMYDKYHDVLEDGDYALVFHDENGNLVGSRELHLDEGSPDEIYMVFNYSPSILSLVAKTVEREEFKRLADEKRLLNPLGYNGY